MFNLRLLAGLGTLGLTLVAGLVVAQPSPTVVPKATPLAASLSGNQMNLGPAGSVQTHTHTLFNAGPFTETFNLTATSRQAWPVTIAPAQVQLPPGVSTTLTVQVTLPANAWPGTVGLTFITATNTFITAPITLRARDSLLVQSNTALNIPPTQMGAWVGGERVYSLTTNISTTEFLPGLQTPTYGYNGSYLGPTLIMTTGEVLSLSVTNLLTEVTTTHWHGLHLPAEMDGGPHQGIEPGTTWRPTFTLLNPASTVWYHPHPHAAGTMSMPHGTHAPQLSTASTGQQVYFGLAGMILIRDSASAALGLPQTYGVDEFPVVVQDRNFNPDGSFREYPALQNRNLRKGNYFLVNGTLAGNLTAPAQLVRLHLLNGSNARFYNFGFADNRSFYQIASDSALLNQPITRQRLVLGPGERAEIVVDLSGLQGQTLYFANYSSELGGSYAGPNASDDYDGANYVLFTLNVSAPTPDPVTTMPATLNNIVRLTAGQAALTRTLTLNNPPAINGTVFDMDVINITTTYGTLEVWSFFNPTEDAHPMHIHDTPFQILSRNNALPPDYELGWKDTVIVRPFERVNVIKSFGTYADPGGPLMYHCHILEHEDDGMMGQYVIIDYQYLYLPFIRR